MFWLVFDYDCKMNILLGWQNYMACWQENWLCIAHQCHTKVKQFHDVNVGSGSLTVEFLIAFSVQSGPSLNGILANTDFTSNWQGRTLSDSDEDYCTGCWNISHRQRQSYSGLRSPTRSCSNHLQMTAGVFKHFTVHGNFSINFISRNGTLFFGPLWPVWINDAHLDMDWKISSSCICYCYWWHNNQYVGHGSTYR